MRGGIIFKAMRAITCIALSLSATIAVAQQFPIRNYSVNDGLTRNAVRAIHQDVTGRIWFATTDGLDRYDGAAFSHFTVAQGLSSDFINDIAEDSTGAIWIATNFTGLDRYHDGHFANFLVSPESPSAFSNSINKIFIDKVGRFWAATDGGFFLFNGSGFSPVDGPTTVIAIAEDNNGTIWVGTTNGLMKLAGTPGDFRLEPAIASIEVSALTCDRDGILWVGTRSGLLTYFTKQGLSQPWQAGRLINSLRGEWIRVLVLDPDNTLWIGTDGKGVIRFTRDGMLTRIDESNGLAGNIVLDIVRDREGNVWFGTTTGLSKLINEQIISYTHIHGLPDHAVSAVSRDGTGATWFGTRFGLARLEDGGIHTFTEREGLADDYILTLFTDESGTLWCGTERGPSRFVQHRTHPRFISYGERQGWTKSDGGKNRVRAIYQDDERNLWFGNDNGVSLLRGERFINYPIDGKYGDRLVAGILRDAWGDLWVGLHGGGILRFEVGSRALHMKQRISVTDGLRDDRIRCAYRTREGHLWFGTRFGGAVKIVLEDQRIVSMRSYTTDDGLVSDWVNGFVEDRKGNLWIATSRGVSCLTFSSDNSNVTAIRTLTVFDGLAGDGVNSVYEDINGFLWFATYNGVTRYDPSGDLPPPVPPAVFITTVSVSGQADTSALREKRTVLPYQHQSIAFEFVGVSFRDEARVRYKYMLEGFDSTWSVSSNRRYAQYTHLPPGNYVFKVTAQNGEGLWSTEPASFSFTVVAPLWAQWWFIGSAAILVATITWLVYRYRVQHLLALERMRLRIAADLHDDVGSTLSSIAIASEMARQEIAANTSSVTETLGKITTNARAMLEHLDDIVWTINPSNDLLDDMLLRMKVFAADILEARGIAYIITFPEHAASVKTPMEVRRHVYLMFKEAINNIARHSGCTKVEIGLELGTKVLILTVKDNGRGFDVRSSYPGTGLRNIQRRAAAIGADLVVQSAPGSGATICITAPLT